MGEPVKSRGPLPRWLMTIKDDFPIKSPINTYYNLLSSLHLPHSASYKSVLGLLLDLVIRRICPGSLKFAAIDPLPHSKNPFPSSPSTHQPSATPTIYSSPQSDKRRSLVTDQIYQFALGYPQTPPEPSPLLEAPVDSRDGQEILGSAMGSFVFKWYVHVDRMPQHWSLGARRLTA